MRKRYEDFKSPSEYLENALKTWDAYYSSNGGMYKAISALLEENKKLKFITNKGITIPKEEAVFRCCSSCLFVGTYRDMGASCSVCTVEQDLTKAIKRFDDNEKCGCNMFMTKEEAILYKLNECSSSFT